MAHILRLDERIPEKGFSHPDDMLEAYRAVYAQALGASRFPIAP